MRNFGSLDSQTAVSSTVDGGNIEVGNPRVDGSVLRCEVTASGQVARFLTGDPLRVDYNQPIENVPASLLVVPPLAQICPVAWAMGADVTVDRIDPEFLVALNRIRGALERLYPSLVRGGEIQYEKTNCPECRDGTYTPGRPTGKSALLFNGGVDSLATFVGHQWESPTLVALQRWVPESKPEEERVVAQTESFARRHGCETAFVRSNVLSVLDSTVLDHHFGPHLNGSWYNAVGQGLGVLGLCAPLCASRGIEQLMRAASRTREFGEPWGTHPALDSEVRWSGTACRYDGADQTRQEKIERIAQFVREEDPTVTVRDCSSRMSNCNQCELCARTIVGLVVAGLDPRDHGYAVTDETFPEIRAQFEAGQWGLASDQRFAWETIQAAAPQKSPVALTGADGFFEWLADADLSEVAVKPAPPLHHRLARGIVNRSPEPVGRSLSSFVCRVRRVFS
jgi:hypothetical protein